MNHENVDKTNNQENEPNIAEPRADVADPIDLVNQQIEQRPTIDPEEVANNPAVSPEMLNEGDNLRGDLTKE